MKFSTPSQRNAFLIIIGLLCVAATTTVVTRSWFAYLITAYLAIAIGLEVFEQLKRTKVRP